MLETGLRGGGGGGCFGMGFMGCEEGMWFKDEIVVGGKRSLLSEGQVGGGKLGWLGNGLIGGGKRGWLGNGLVGGGREVGPGTD